MIALRNKTVAHDFLPSFDNDNNRLVKKDCWDPEILLPWWRDVTFLLFNWSITTPSRHSLGTCVHSGLFENKRQLRKTGFVVLEFYLQKLFGFIDVRTRKKFAVLWHCGALSTFSCSFGNCIVVMNFDIAVFLNLQGVLFVAFWSIFNMVLSPK